LKIVAAGLGILLVLTTAFLQRPAAAADALMISVIAEDWGSVERLANERLAADPTDAIALHALGRMAIDGNVGSQPLRRKLLPQVQSCLALRPNDGLCQLAYGQILGVELESQGMLAALGSVDKVREAFEAAVAAAPADYDARESLVNFYLNAPGIVGGSMSKARRHAEEFARFDSSRAHLLSALVALHEDDPAKAENELSRLPESSGDADLNRLIANRWLAVGRAYLDQRRYDEAEAAFSRSLAGGAPSVAVKARQEIGEVLSSRSKKPSPVVGN